MGEQKHTPGPWKPRFHCRNRRTLIGDWFFVDGNGSPVRLGGTVEQNVSAAANAHLIAAAPDMLVVLRRIRDSYPGYIPDFIEAVDAAIAKAEGRAP